MSNTVNNVYAVIVLRTNVDPKYVEYLEEVRGLFTDEKVAANYVEQFKKQNENSSNPSRWKLYANVVPFVLDKTIYSSDLYEEDFSKFEIPDGERALVEFVTRPGAKELVEKTKAAVSVTE